MSQVLGHSKVDTTRVYAKPSLKRMRAEMEAAYPESVGEAAEWVGHEDELSAGRCGLRA